MDYGPEAMHKQAKTAQGVRHLSRLPPAVLRTRSPKGDLPGFSSLVSSSETQATPPGLSTRRSARSTCAGSRKWTNRVWASTASNEPRRTGARAHSRVRSNLVQSAPVRFGARDCKLTFANVDAYDWLRRDARRQVTSDRAYAAPALQYRHAGSQVRHEEWHPLSGPSVCRRLTAASPHRRCYRPLTSRGASTRPEYLRRQGAPFSLSRISPTPMPTSTSATSAARLVNVPKSLANSNTPSSMPIAVNVDAIERVNSHAAAP